MYWIAITAVSTDSLLITNRLITEVHMYGETVFVAASGTAGHYRYVSRGVYQF